MSDHIHVLVICMGALFDCEKEEAPHSHTSLLPVSVRLPQTHHHHGDVINTTAEIQGQDLHKGSKKGRRGMLQHRSCIPAIRYSSSGPWVLGLNIAGHMTNFCRICTKSSKDCHLLTVPGTSPTSSPDCRKSCHDPLQQRM